MEPLQIRDVTAWQMAKVFVSTFSELREPYFDLLQEWDEVPSLDTIFPGDTIVFDDVVSPFLLEMLRAADDNVEALTLFFGMMEEMAIHPEQDVRNLLYVTLLEQIVNARPMLYATAIQFAGPATRHELDDVAPRFGITPEPTAHAYVIPPATIPARTWHPWMDDDD